MKNNFNGIIDKETFDKIKSNIKWLPYFEMAIANKSDKLIPLRLKKEMLPYYKAITGDDSACVGCDIFIIYRLAYWFFESEKYYNKQSEGIETTVNYYDVISYQDNNKIVENGKTEENKTIKQGAKRGRRKVQG